MNNKIINEIKNLSISRVISEYISITKKGRNYFAICPFHNDTNPSLVINDEKNIFKCFTCNTSGDAIKFVSNFNNISYPKAIIEIANKFNLNLENFNQQEYINEYQNNYDLNKDYLDLCQVYLYQPKFQYAYDYLKSRNINDNDIKKFKIGFNPTNKESNIYNILTNEKIINLNEKKSYKRETLLENGLITLNSNAEPIDFFQNRIVFSISNENDEIVGFSGRSIDGETPKYLNSPQTIIFNKSEILYNYNNFLKSDNQWSIYIVEGFMDAIALDKVNISNVVATMGITLTDQHINLLKKNKNIESVILAFDNDSAGINACIKNGLLIANHFNTFVINHSNNNFKDFDEILNKDGPDALINIANNIIPFSLYYLQIEINKIKNLADFEHQYKSNLDFLRKYGSVNYIKDYLNIFTTFSFPIDINKIIADLNDIFQKKNNKYEFSQRLKPKSTNIKNKNIINVKEGYNYTIDRLIIACLIDHSIPNIIINNYKIQMDKNLYNILNVLIEFYSHNPNINSININTFEIFKEFVLTHKYNLKIIDVIEEKMNDNYQLLKQYSYDINTLMKQIYYSQIIKIDLFINEENKKNQLLSIDSSEKSESSIKIVKYIKLKNELIKLMKKCK